MAKGQESKRKVVEMIAAAAKDDWIGEYNGKYYVWSNEDGQRTQVAIALTCPKTQIDVAVGAQPVGNILDFSGEAPAVNPVVVNKVEPAEITEEEVANISNLLAKLGL